MNCLWILLLLSCCGQGGGISCGCAAGPVPRSCAGQASGSVSASCSCVSQISGSVPTSCSCTDQVSVPVSSSCSCTDSFADAVLSGYDSSGSEPVYSKIPRYPEISRTASESCGCMEK